MSKQTHELAPGVFLLVAKARFVDECRAGRSSSGPPARALQVRRERRQDARGGREAGRARVLRVIKAAAASNLNRSRGLTAASLPSNFMLSGSRLPPSQPMFSWGQGRHGEKCVIEPLGSAGRRAPTPTRSQV
jgi:hypothetical protein